MEETDLLGEMKWVLARFLRSSGDGGGGWQLQRTRRLEISEYWVWTKVPDPKMAIWDATFQNSNAAFLENLANGIEPNFCHWR